ncbi:hypothetical protein CLV33_103187 [Jejuia pallidilutea]|uniref:DUF4468 domain-containing protein n=1 Tax=Jejuia pallidilutea TaxID=504487 RepID=A0A362X0Z7_9FLAO|nr:hypothetical protein [Jejuia pallidilutea]PQV49551.1 hypothetical protein CLV33_103187 [Jejuia pallidilutea]
MKILQVFVFFVSINLISQDKFSFNENGVNPAYIVNNVKSKTQEELFTGSVKWVKKTYLNPDVEINTQIKNEEIRFTGIEKACLKYKALGIEYSEDLKYVISVSFKEGRYKFEPILLETRSASGWTKINPKYYYKKNGKIKKIVKDYPQIISNLLNSINNKLLNFLINGSKNKDDW